MKSYVTPMLSFESFELTSNTASACGKPTRTPTNRTCGVTVPGVGNVFLMEWLVVTTRERMATTVFAMMSRWTLPDSSTPDPT